MESMNRSAILLTLSPSPDAAPHGGDGGGHPAAAGIIADGERPVNSSARRSVRRFVLRERLLELLHDGIRVAAGLANVVGPLLLQRLGRLFPLAQLGVGDGVDLMSRFGLHLRQAGVLEVRPWVGEFTR